MNILNNLFRSLRLNVPALPAGRSAPQKLEPSRFIGTGSKFHLIILALISAVLFFWNIHVIPLTDGDSAFYAKIAKNIVDGGDWLTMHYGDASTIIDKPPLVMWITAASFKLFGVNEFAVNFWHSLCALLTVMFTYKLAKELFDSKTAFLSALVLATSAQFFYQARSPLQDIPLTLFVLLSVYAYILFEKRSNVRYFYLSSVFVSLAVLTKGPVGLVLPAIILLAYLIVSKNKLPAIPHIIAVAILFLVITLPWFIIEYNILGKRFLDIFIGHNFGRYFRPIDTIGNEASKYSGIKPQYDFYSYFLQLLIVAVPWSGFVYPAIYHNIKKKASLLPVVFALSVLLFFSLSLNYKISRYILLAFPRTIDPCR
ncbi:MAG: glycosyltransferase family 39 protein [bacterium]